MGRHRRRLSSAFTSASLARARLESVFRLTQNRPLFEVAQMCVNPRNVNVSGFPSPRPPGPGRRAARTRPAGSYRGAGPARTGRTWRPARPGTARRRAGSRVSRGLLRLQRRSGQRPGHYPGQPHLILSPGSVSSGKNGREPFQHSSRYYSQVERPYPWRSDDGAVSLQESRRDPR